MGFNLNGRLGIETIRPVQGCCVETMLKWRPNIIGQKSQCLYCDNGFKAIRAAELDNVEWTGMVNETRKEVTVQDLGAAEIWFSKRKFADIGDVMQWCDERAIEVTRQDDSEMAYRVVLGKALPGTERVVWASPGVMSVVGVVSKIDTGDMSAGGQLHPYQGPNDDKIDVDEDSNSKDTKPEDAKCAKDEATDTIDVMKSFEERLNGIFLEK